MVDDVVLAYLAGVIDSDGYISASCSLHKSRRYVGIVVGISGTRREPHDLAASLFGGTVRVYVPRRERSHHRPQFQWQRYGRSALPVIEAVRPYLRVKRDQAELGLLLHERVEEARGMRSSDDPYPWFGPNYDPEADLVFDAREIQELNTRRKVDGRTWDEMPG